ncbi:hypothetical protein E3N88_10063 [Mikania micrantha]|uniref:Uncharacterized protein n=1 Tax=Mikania micrantha TaxID=192012 RepID=A0A5N6PBB7_9ASTR|nr:hypothetical protein E3N88_10063 [Mikania micrantha]
MDWLKERESLEVVNGGFGDGEIIKKAKLKSSRNEDESIPGAKVCLTKKQVILSRKLVELKATFLQYREVLCDTVCITGKKCQFHNCKAIEEENTFLPHHMPSYNLGLTQKWADIRPGAIWLQQAIILLQEVVAESCNLRRH